MAIGSSVIIVEKSIDSTITIGSYGCSEFPAHDSYITRYTSIGLAVYADRVIEETVNITMGAGYTTLRYMSDWANFIAQTFPADILKGGEELFKAYTIADYKIDAIKMSGLKLRLGINRIDGGPSGWGYTVRNQEVSDESVIGLTTNSNYLRSICGGGYLSKKGVLQSGSQICRKVQIGHTLFRLMWSSGWMIPLLTLRIKEVSDSSALGLTNLNCLWMAYKIKFAMTKTYSDYGDIFRADSGYVSEKCVYSRILDNKNNGSLMNIFLEEQNPLAAELGLSKTTFDDTDIMTPLLAPGIKYNASHSSLLSVIKSIDVAAVTMMAKYVNQCKAELEENYLKIKFKFSKSLFRSAATGVCYEGILKPNSKLNRVLFKDEENSTLSVLRESKFIKELK